MALNQPLLHLRDATLKNPLDISTVSYQALLNEPLSKSSPIFLKVSIPESVLESIPFFKLCRLLLNMVSARASIKLTVKGSLPLNDVKALLDSNLIPMHPSVDRSKALREENCSWILSAKGCCIAAGLLKKRHGKLELTASYFKHENDPPELFRKILIAFLEKYDWSQLDSCGARRVGQYGWGVVVHELQRTSGASFPTFYFTDIYGTCLPEMAHEFGGRAGYSSWDRFLDCVEYRMLDCFLSWFALVEIDEDGDERLVTATPLLKEVFGLFSETMDNSTRLRPS